MKIRLYNPCLAIPNLKEPWTAMRAAEFARVRISLTSNFGIPLADVAGTRCEGTGKSVTFVTAE